MADAPISITGLTVPVTEPSFTAGNGSDGGPAYNYTLVVAIPVPALSVNFDLVGDFVLPALAQTGIPQALDWVITNGVAIFQEAIDVAMELIRAIPEIVVSIQVRVGTVAILNVQLIASKEPVEVPVPTFILGLPNVAIGDDIDLNALFPTPPPVVIRIPIPVPRLALPAVAVTGGNVSVDTDVTLGESEKPPEILNPVKIPVL